MAGPNAADTPVLSVAIPTRDRPDLLERALRSVVCPEPRHAAAVTRVARSVEVVVCDNAANGDDNAARGVAEPILATWPGPTRYVRHRPAVGMVDNFNACVSASSGRYVHILHDDDYLVPGGLTAIVHLLDAGPPRPALLFGVNLVDLHGRVRRRQIFRRDRDLPPPTALRRVLSNSSFVRFPAIVVRRDAYDAVGPFDPEVGGPTDFDMWVRLFARFGVLCVAATTAAYTRHDGAATAKTFNESTLATLMSVFDRASRWGVLDPATVRRSETDFLHQFILGGTYRSLKNGDRAAAAQVMRLFRLPEVRALGVSPRWLAVRLAFSLATVGADSPRAGAPVA